MSIKKVPYQNLLDDCNFLPDRTPETTDFSGAFKMVSEYQQGTIYVGHYAGSSEWELHYCDEVVLVLEGEAEMFQLRDGQEISESLKSGELTVVPAETWHRFSVNKEVKIMTITTKQPSEYSVSTPQVV